MCIYALHRHEKISYVTCGLVKSPYPILDFENHQWPQDGAPMLLLFSLYPSKAGAPSELRSPAPACSRGLRFKVGPSLQLSQQMYFPSPPPFPKQPSARCASSGPHGTSCLGTTAWLRRSSSSKEFAPLRFAHTQTPSSAPLRWGPVMPLLRRGFIRSYASLRTFSSSLCSPLAATEATACQLPLSLLLQALNPQPYGFASGLGPHFSLPFGRRVWWPLLTSPSFLIIV